MSFHKLTGVTMFAGLIAFAWASAWPVLTPGARGQEVEAPTPKIPKPAGASSAAAPETPGTRARTADPAGGPRRGTTFVLHNAVVEGVGADGGTLSVVLGINRYPGGNVTAVEPDGTRIPTGNLRPRTHLVDLLLKDVSVSHPNPQPRSGRRKTPGLADLKKGTHVGLTILVEDDRLLVTAVTIED